MKRTLVISLALGIAQAAPLYAQTGAGTAAATAIAEPINTTVPGNPAAANAPTPTGTLARAAVTTAVVNREPRDALTSIANDKDRLYYFTELKDMAGQAVTHRWEHNGKVMSEVKFDVGASRWRIYSSKTLDPSWTGNWKVSVIDANGVTIGENTFSYIAANKAMAEPSGAVTPATEAVPATPTTPTTTH